VIVRNRLRSGLAQFQLCAHFLECGSESFDLLLLPRVGRYKPSDGRLLLLIFAMLFEELVEQHRVHRLVPHSIRVALLAPRHQVGTHLFHFLKETPLA
jgi:hypothetical protein